MTPLILFYNLSNENGKKIRLICLKLHIRIKQVDPVDYAKPIGMLAGIKDFPAPQIGNRIVVLKEAFIRWVEQHTGAAE